MQHQNVVQLAQLRNLLVQITGRIRGEQLMLQIQIIIGVQQTHAQM